MRLSREAAHDGVQLRKRGVGLEGAVRHWYDARVGTGAGSEEALARHTPRRDALAHWLPPAATLLLAAPVLLVSYLPMTDLPQHLAATSILRHLDDPRYEFREYYVPADDPALRALSYTAQYAVVRALSGPLSLEAAMHGFVFLSVLAIPLGVLGFLRALRKPAWLALLALPFVYNRAFFWGFASFNLALGVGLGVCALLAHERWSAARALGVAALASAIVFVHVYGIAFVLGYLALWLLLGERRAWLRRAPTAAIPTLLGGLGWAWSGRSAAGFSESFSPPFGRRMAGLPDALLGGYRDPSEAAILVALLATLALLCHRAVSTRCAALAALPHHERVLWLYIALNAVLYLVLPQHTLTAKFVHFRHAILAAVMLPLVVPRNALAAHPLLSRGALTALAAATIANAWIHLALFDREARSFEGVIAALPERSRVVALTWERNGSVVETIPYVHFAAYAQARKGGLLATTFPGFFWNLPLRLRDDVGIPPTPISLEMHPQLFDHQSFGRFYDFVLVRGGPRAPPPRDDVGLAYALLYEAPPWRLYRVPSGRGEGGAPP